MKANNLEKDIVSKLQQGLKQVEQLATGGKLLRLMNGPTKYIQAMWFRYLEYPKNKIPKKVKSKVFWGDEMTMAIPSSSDIYINGGKSHSSEIRLVKFMLHYLKPDMTVLDIGAHYGYFALLANKLVQGGRVFAFEPATYSYEILAENCRDFSHLEAHNKAVSDKDGTVVFYEFDNLHSEYNTSDIRQFEHEAWFKEHPPLKVEIPCVSISSFCSAQNLSPNFIKIDVEGLEDIVINGAVAYLSSAPIKPVFVMEYLASSRSNEPHKHAAQTLKNLGYNSYEITADGTLKEVAVIDEHLIKMHLDSDNIVFMYPTP